MAYDFNTYRIDPRIKYGNTTNYSKIDSSRILKEETYKMHLTPPFWGNNVIPPTEDEKGWFKSRNQCGTLDYRHNTNAIYKSQTVKNARNNGNQEMLEYLYFYKDWKKDSVSKLPDPDPETKLQTQTMLNKYNNIICNVSNNTPYQKLYEETKRKDKFAMPMAINGSNKVEDMYNNCLNKKTFEFKRYSNISPSYKQWLDNPLYNGNVSQESEALKIMYMTEREVNKDNIYDSVYEDMAILNYNPNDDDIDKNINSTFGNRGTGGTGGTDYYRV